MLSTGPAPVDEAVEGPTEAATPLWVKVAVATVMLLGTALRFVTPSGLWLDEALSVNISRLPLGRIPEALRHDGAPPLFYLLLHGWTRVFGIGDFAVRSLSGTLGMIALPLMWMAGRRLGGRRVAWMSLLLLASCPFAVRYATEARMYSLVVVLVLAGLLSLLAVLDGPGWPPRILLALSTGLLMLTHYWSLYLVAAVAGLLVLWLRSPFREAGARRGLVSMAGGVVLFLPWLPSFLYQARHTGTPWAAAPRLRALLDTVIEFAGGYWDPGLGLGLLYLVLFSLGLWGRALDARRIELDLRGHPPGSALALVCFATMALAMVAARVTGSAFTVRYASVILPLVLLLAALGTTALASTRARWALVAAATILGLAAVVPNATGPRTTAGRVANVLEALADPGDVVAYCPDQLGPSVSRVLASEGLVQLTYPRATPPQFVDWVDYAEVNRKASPAAFARSLLERAGPGRDVWVVWSPGYRTFGTSCQELLEDLGELRTEQRLVRVGRRTFERMGLVRFPAGSVGSAGTASSIPPRA